MVVPRRAIVMGASVAGLLAAGVLSDHFDDVVIVERDTLPRRAEFRRGVPQSRRLHEPPSELIRPSVLGRALRGPQRPLLTAPPTNTPLTPAVGQPV